MPRRDLADIDRRDQRVIDTAYQLLYRPMKAWFRAEVRGVERIPTGPGLYVGNHNGGLVTPDSFLFAGRVIEARGMIDVPYGLAHETIMRIPPFQQLLPALGGVPATHDAAHRLFEAGRKVIVYPGGDLEAMRPYRHRDRIVFGGRTGYIRLALREGVPIIPVVAAGAHATFVILDDLRWLARLLRLDRTLRLKVLPLTLSVPWGLTLGVVPTYLPLPTRILVEILEPIHFDPCGPDAADDPEQVRRAADRVEGIMQAALTRLAAERRAR